MAGNKLCLHNKFGFCKHGDKCRKEHVQEICQDNECNQSECRRRHPKECKYFKLYKRCKFNDFCAFSHVIPLDPVLEEVKLLKENVKALEKEVKEKNHEIKVLLRNLEAVLNSINLSNSASSKVSTSHSTVTVLTSDMSKAKASSNITSGKANIPQIDGQVDDDECKCENCNKIFENEKQLQTHLDQHGWGCDECFVCFTTKLSADLHEMEYHGHDPDSISYIRNHIPESTKQMFAAGHRQRPN